jgi:hypothetical protein
VLSGVFSGQLLTPVLVAPEEKRAEPSIGWQLPAPMRKRLAPSARQKPNVTDTGHER